MVEDVGFLVADDCDCDDVFVDDGGGGATETLLRVCRLTCR